MAKAIDLTGPQFGKLIVLEPDSEIQKRHPNERQAWWKCKCEACRRRRKFTSIHD